MAKGLYGYLSIRDGLITLSNEDVKDAHRRNFTLAHEIGHLYLHKDILLGKLNEIEEYDDSTLNVLPEQIIKRMELQANLFASYLLMPQVKFLYEVTKLFSKYAITTGRLYLDNQPCNIRDVEIIVSSLSGTFNVSKSAVRMRLLNASLLKVGDG